MNNPERMCVVCRGRFSKKDLLRVVKTDSQVVFDESLKMNGRGAYICRTCIFEKKKRQGLAKAVKAEISEEIWAKMEEYCR